MSVSELQADFNNLVNSRGQIIRIKYYTQTILGAGSYYDDQISLSQSGSNLWTSGIIQSIGGKTSSDEALLMEQGKILMGDKRLYIAGSLSTSGAAIKIGLGSPPSEEYRITEAGVDSYSLMGADIYKKVFVRILTNGSIYGE